MKKILFTLGVFIFSAMVQADCQIRELGRVSIFDQEAGEWVDSAIIQYMFGTDFYGQSRICSDNNRSIKTIEFDANLVMIDGEVAHRFEIYDDVDVLSFTQNGALYDVRSRYLEFGDYSIRFVRRAPEYQLVVVNGQEHIVPNYDRVTIFSLERDGWIWELDYRGTVND